MNKEEMDAVDILCKEVLKYIDRAIKEKVTTDRTYKSVVKNITPKGYVILDNAGSERTVPCCIPNMELRVGQYVWVKEPMGDLKGLHICGVIEKAGNSGRRR